MVKNQFPPDFQTVVDYLKLHNVNVIIDSVTCYIKTDDEQTICIHHNYNLEKNGLFALLHEAGHVLQTDHYYGPNHYKNIDDMTRPKEYNMYQFINEVNAWDLGYGIARGLKIPINDRDWQRAKTEALLTYYV
jgi:hypothetical protein